MTTAFLSVGLDTDPALKSLRALQTQMRTTPLPLEFSLNNIDQQVMKELHRRNFTVRLGAINLGNVSKQMADQINNDADIALQKAFLKVRHVTFDHALLTTQVSAAVKAGLAGHVMPVGAVVAGGAATARGVADTPQTGAEPRLIAALQRTMHQILEPVTMELRQATLALTSAAKATGIARSAGGASAKESISAKDPVTGFTTGYSRKLEDPGAELARIQQARQNQQTLKDDEEGFKRVRASRAALVEQRVAEVGKAEKSSLKTLAESEARMAASRAALVEQRVAEVGKAEKSSLKTLAESEARMAASRAALVDQRVAEVGKAEKAGAAAEVERVARSNASRKSLLDQKLVEIGKVEKAGLDAQKASLIAFYEKAKFDAAKLFTGQGASIAAAQQTSAVFGRAATTEFLGPKKGYLLDATNELENFRIKAGAATVATQHHAAAMKDAHSAARGLASGFGAMWLTWGSLAPLMAGAAISGTIVSSMKKGMEVSQELATIKFLGEESAEGVGALNAALLDTRANGPFGPVEVSKALKTLSMAGLNATQQLEALHAVENFSIVGQVDLEKSAESLVAISTAFGYTSKDFSVVGDVVSKAAAVSMASVESMTASFRTASVVAQQYKVSLNDTATTLALLSQIGIRGTAGGTAMRQMYSELAGSSKKARKILEETLNVDVIDKATGGMRALSKIIPELAASLSRFDAKGQIHILQDMGNERGTKALVANLAAYRTELDRTGKTAKTELERMQKLMEDAPGFMAEAAIGMSLTSQNQVKAVGAALESSLIQAFQKIEPTVLEVSMQLRNMFASSQFKSGVQTLVTNVANLTLALMEHGKIIYEVIKAYVAWKVVTLEFAAVSAVSSMISLLGQGFMRLGAQATIGAIGTVGLTTALAAAPAATAAASVGFLRLQAAMGWIGVIGTAIAGAITLWMMYGNKSTEAAEASTRAAKSTAEATIAAMEEEIKSINLRREARRKGVTETALAQEKQVSATLDNIRASYDEERALLRVALAQAIVNRNRMAASNAPPAFVEREDKKVDTAATALGTNLSNAAAAEAKAADVVSRLRAAARADAEEAAKEAAERQKKPLGGKTFGEVDKAAAAAARAEDKSQVRAVIQGIRDEEAAMVQAAKFRKDLDAAKYNPNLFGQQIGAYLAEQRAIELTTENYRLEEKAIRDLKEVQKLPNLNKADRENIDTEIAREEAELKLARLALQHQKEIADANSIERARQEAFNEKKTRSKLGADDAQELAKIQAAFELKVVDPAVAAQITAQLAVQGRYAGDIAKYADKVEETEAAIVAMRERRATLSQEEQAAEDGRIEVLQASLGLDMSRLAILKAQASAASSLAGAAAKKGTEDARTAAYGFDKFWVEYVDSAQSSAKLVEGIMKTSTDYMSTTFGNFVSGTQQDFKALTVSMLQDVTRMLANQMMQKFLMMAGNAFMSSFGGVGATNGNGGYSYGGTSFNNPSAFVPVTGHAKGGVMTEYGNLPLRKYASGGVEHGPALSVHGEGSLPEANVPLQDGRTIPVTITGGGNGGTKVQLNVINNGPPVKATQSTRETPQGSVIDLVLEAVAADMAGGGRVHDATQRRFGLNPGGTTPRY